MTLAYNSTGLLEAWIAERWDSISPPCCVNITEGFCDCASPAWTGLLRPGYMLLLIMLLITSVRMLYLLLKVGWNEHND